MIAHASDSAEQRAIEREILAALEVLDGVRFTAAPPALGGLQLDGYAGGDVPLLVEVFAHVGPSKPGQRKKITHDMAKLLLAERRLGVACRKVVAVIDAAAVAHLRGGWEGAFAREFDVAVRVVPGFEARHAAMREVQARQRR